MKTFKIEHEAIAYSVSNPLEAVEFKTYWGNCNIWGHCFYVNGLKHGEYKDYHKNGQLYNNCFYVNGEAFDVDHLRDGSYKSLCILSTLFDGNLCEDI